MTDDEAAIDAYLRPAAPLDMATPGIDVAASIAAAEHVRSGITARELMSKVFPPIKFVVPGYVVEGLTVFAGAPKLGKSWAVLDWSVAVAKGDYAFGSILCQQGDVLYLALEDNHRRLQSRLRQMAIVDAPDRLTFETEWPDLDGECIDRLEQWLNAVSAPRLIVIDVFAKIRGVGTQRENQYELDYKYAAKLQRLAILFNVAIVLVHHTRKQDADDPFDSVSGTRGLTGAADTVLVLKRDASSQQPILYGRGRDLMEVETALAFEGEKGRWSVLGDASMVAHTVERRLILELLGRAVDPMSPTEIADALAKSRSTINHTLTKLFEDTKVKRVSRGKYTLMTPFHSVHSVHSGDVEVNEVNKVKGG